MIKTIGYAAKSATSPLEVYTFERRELQDHDVQIETLYCGVCYSDIDWARNFWNTTVYPVVPGHEVLGRVTALGHGVISFKVGDVVALSAIVDSCGICHECQNHREQYCEKGPTFICNSFDKYTKGVTYGGFSKQIVVEEKSVVHIPEKLQKENLASSCSLALRWHYDLFSAQALERGQREESGNCWYWRVRPSCGQICSCFGSRGGCDYYVP